MKSLFKFIRKVYSLYWTSKYYFLFRKVYDISPTARFNGIHIDIYGNGNFKMGDNSYLGSLSTVQLEEGFSCVIGNNVRISHNVRIYTSSIYADQNLDKNPFEEKHKNKLGNVLIGNGVWIGANVLINPNVTIGNNAVIGANSVVTKDVKENSIYGGVPARFIKQKIKEL